MAGSVNKAILIGNLGRDPEVRTFQSGDRVVSFPLATTESWRDKTSGERKDKTEWHNVQVFNDNLGKIAEQYLRKGSKVYIEGQIQTREYIDKDGNQRRSTEIVLQRFGGSLTLFDSKSGGETKPETPVQPVQPVQQAKQASLSAQLDDDIPFEMAWR